MELEKEKTISTIITHFSFVYEKVEKNKNVSALVLLDFRTAFDILLRKLNKIFQIWSSSWFCTRPNVIFAVSSGEDFTVINND